MEPNPQPASDSELAKLEAKREYANQFRAKQRELNRVTPDELLLFQADPLQEEKLALQEKDWGKVIVCRLCGFKAGRLTNHLKVFHGKDLSNGFEATAAVIADKYRKRFGYNKGEPLSCREFREGDSQKLKSRNSHRQFQGRPSVGHGTRFKKKRAATPSGIHPGVEARKEWGTSQQAKQRMSASRKGRPNIKNRKRRNATGEVVATASDWQRARLRLAGKELSQIAKKLQLDEESVRQSLHRMRFPPGRPPCFFRGEAVGHKHLLAHFADLKYIRHLRSIEFRANTDGVGARDKELTVREAAELLGVPATWIYAHTRQSSKDPIPHSRTVSGVLRFIEEELLNYSRARHHGTNRFMTTVALEEELARRLGVSARRVHGFVAHPESYRNPLLISLGERLLSSIASLRSEFRQLGSTAKGGRPKALLPSEEEELHGKYDALKFDLQLMLSWAEQQHDTITLEIVGEWMCVESGLGNLRLILFWPGLHEQLPAMCESVRNRLR